MNQSNIRKAIAKTLRNFLRVIPIILGVFLVLALVVSVVPPDFYTKAFTGIPAIDALIGAGLGSISAGNPLTSYIIGGELLQKGVGLIAVTAFILSWVTVGLVQLPAEALILGRRFAVVRNLVNFVLAIIMASLVVLTLGLIQ